MKNFNPTSTILPLLLWSAHGLFGQIPVMEDFVVIKNETAINTRQLEYSPAFYKDGLVFISTNAPSPKYQVKDKHIGMNIMSIFRARRDNQGTLMPPEVFATELLSIFHEGPLTFDRTNETVYFTRNNDAKERKDIRKLKIYSAELVGEKWQNLRELPINDEDYETCHPSISVENDAIYFASNREGGYGGMDIWVSYRQGDDWGLPVNLGASVNTTGNEVFPFIHADGTLYYASNGLGGNGQLDMYFALKNGETWSAPVNLGKPFNSEFDDFGFIIDRDNKNGYFSSNRQGGLGGDDIYNFYIIGTGGIAQTDKKKSKTGKAEVPFAVYDAETGLLIEDATVSIIDLDEITLGEAMADGSGALKLVPTGDGQTYRLDFGQGATTQPDSKGNLAVPYGNVMIKVEKEGYQTQYLTANPDQLDKGGLNLKLEKPKKCMPLDILVAGDAGVFPLSGAVVVITNLQDKTQMTLVTDAAGKANYCLPCDQDFSVLATKNGLVSNNNTVSTKPCQPGQSLSTKLLISGSGTPLVEGTVIQLPHIYFNFNDAALRPDAQPDLDALVALLEMFPNMTIELASHTDARGASRYNLALSQERSDNVQRYLVENGIDPQRVEAIGYGEMQIRNRCVDGVKCNESEHQQNRRTEVVITSLGEAAESQVPIATPVSLPEPVASENASEETGRKYLVIAGTFKNAENAQSRLEELKLLGFPNAEILQFKGSVYQSVCAAQYADDTEARTLAGRLRDDYSIDTYVKSNTSLVR